MSKAGIASPSIHVGSLLPAYGRGRLSLIERWSSPSVYIGDHLSPYTPGGTSSSIDRGSLLPIKGRELALPV